MDNFITDLAHPLDAPLHTRARTAPGKLERYGFGLFATVAAVLLQYMIWRHINKDAFDFFLAAVFLSALYGGLGPAMLTSVTSIVALDYFFIAPINGFAYAMTDLFRLAVFGAVAILTSSLSVRLKLAKSNLEKAHNELEVRIQQRTEDLFQSNKSLREEIAQRRQAEKEILEISHREQRRLGQDLHDGLCQTLAGVKLISEQLKETLGASGLPQEKDAALIESRLSEALGQADIVSRGLYPVELETNGLMAALQELAEKISKTHAVRCRFKCFEAVPITDSAVAIHVYRIAQEAMANAIKGGKAKHINVSLRRRKSHVLLSVADNGIGFNNKPLRRGMGLKIMEYRARMINGSLLLRSHPRGGTVMNCRFAV